MKMLTVDIFVLLPVMSDVCSGTQDLSSTRNQTMLCMQMVDLPNNVSTARQTFLSI